MRKTGKILSILITLCMIFCLVPFSVYADNNVPSTKWDDFAATEFAGGTGTKDDPYQIATAEQLAKLSKDVAGNNSYAGAYFRLESNIDLSAHRWIPIGYYVWYDNGATINKSFKGFLDGNGKTITGMVVDSSNDKYSAGLFGYIVDSKNDEVGVKDLTITDAYIYVDESELTESRAGILAASVMINDGYKGKGTFENITVSGTIEVKATYGSNKTGGLIGDNSRSIVKNCKADVIITGSSNAGGMVGVSANSVYENCEAKGKISGLWGLGGFVGYSKTSTWDDKTTESTFTRCIADVEIEASDWNVGGFVGLAEFGKFENSASLGKVTSTVENFEPRVGGFVGGVGDRSYLDNSNATFIKCHSASLVTSASEEYNAGGFAGNFVDGSFTDCSYDKDKNAELNAIGEGGTAITIQPTTSKSQEVLANICEDVYGGHEYSEEYTVDEQPTCTEEGSQSRHCIRCDAKGEPELLPANEHDWDSEYTVDKSETCTEDGVKSIHCKKCDAKKDEVTIAATGHTLVWVIDKEPTKTQDGWKHQSCEKGDYEGDPVKIPATGASKAPQTGDATGTMAMAAVLMLVSGAGLLVVSSKQKKYSK